MSMTQEKIELTKKLTVTTVVDVLAHEQSISSEEALRRFLKTKTYALLMSDKSMLYTESTEYVLDMLQSEINGDWEAWQKI